MLVDSHMPMPRSRSSRQQAVDTALQLAREGNRRDLLEFLRSFDVKEATASSDELWLLGKRAYLANDYADAVRLFASFDSHFGSRAAPAWQRYMSFHDRAFAYLKLGQYTTVEAIMKKARALITGSAGLAAYAPDLDAMEAHRAELLGDFETALARFQRAHQEARRLANHKRAATTASDAGRVLGILGRPAEALPWFDRARDDLAKDPDSVIEITLDLRLGMLHVMLEESENALKAFTRVIHSQGSTSTVADALARRADLFRFQKRYVPAEADLQQALHLCRTTGLRHTEVYLHKDLAALYSERDGRGDRAAAEHEFGAALELALAFEPPQPLVLRQLAEDLLARETLSGRARLAEDLRKDLAKYATQLKELSHPSVYQRATRQREWEHARQQLEESLRRLRNPPIRLATCVVSPFSGRVTDLNGNELGRLSSALLPTLEVLLNAPEGGISVAEIADRLHTGVDGTIKRLQRLRQVIGTQNMTERRKGNQRYFSARAQRPE